MIKKTKDCYNHGHEVNPNKLVPERIVGQTLYKSKLTNHVYMFYMLIVGQIAYLLLPAYLANAMGTLLSRCPFLAAPIDGGKNIFGSNKTWRGAIFGILAALIVVLTQNILYSVDFFQKISLLDYPRIHWLMFGLLAGGGAIFGDLAKSFLKRCLKLAAGAPLPPLDQIDFLIGFFFFTALIVDWRPAIIIVAFLITLIIHPLSNIIAYFLKIKNVWW